MPLYCPAPVARFVGLLEAESWNFNHSPGLRVGGPRWTIFTAALLHCLSWARPQLGTYEASVYFGAISMLPSFRSLFSISRRFRACDVQRPLQTFHASQCNKLLVHQPTASRTNCVVKRRALVGYMDHPVAGFMSSSGYSTPLICPSRFRYFDSRVMSSSKSFLANVKHIKSDFHSYIH
jgi:hypothetical protein